MRMYQQFEIEDQGVPWMTLAEHTVTSHKEYCSKIGIFDAYAEVANSFKGSIGGALEDESAKHLLGRFLNSAARTQVIACIEGGNCTDITVEVLGLLTEGHIYLIDIAAGHGAGTMSLLNTICKMRENDTLPKDALDVVIHAIDFSEKSLSYYEELLASLDDVYRAHGISVKIYKHQIDITDDDVVRKEIDAIKQDSACNPELGIGSDPRYLLLCSAISGVSKKVFLRDFSASYQMITESFKENNSAFLWVEPLTEKAWMPKHWENFMGNAQPSSDEDPPAEKNIARQEYDWIDPHSEAKLKTAGDYFLLSLAKT